jgi:uncharacterized protein
MNYLKRKIESELSNLESMFPVITITGPRQSGKTTLAKHIFPGLPYINLENPDQRLFALTDPRAFLKRLRDGAVLDEVQHVPDILSYLQQIVDENRGNIRFVLTGSNQFLLMDKISQSLAGRTALIKLLPFSIEEIPDIQTKSTDQLLFNGFFPGIYQPGSTATRLYRNYYETYIEKDLRQLLQVKDLNQFQRFVHLCAGRIGNIFNASSLANELGVSSKTIHSWISVLEASYIIMLLHPYYKNVSKRMIKSPKIYFYDVGLASYLLGIEKVQQI